MALYNYTRTSCRRPTRERGYSGLQLEAVALGIAKCALHRNPSAPVRPPGVVATPKQAVRARRAPAVAQPADAENRRLAPFGRRSGRILVIFWHTGAR